MENTSDYNIVFVTTDNFEVARNISRILVSENIAACCSIIQNVNSVFIWEGKLDEVQECLIMIKTHKVKLENLETRVKELHTYDVPEIISFKMDTVSKSYLKWMESTLVYG